jgi:hypothetical protein
MALCTDLENGCEQGPPWVHEGRIGLALALPVSPYDLSAIRGFISSFEEAQDLSSCIRLLLGYMRGA